MWRHPDENSVLLMAGQTTSYAVEPRGEYVFGIVTRQAMRSRRGRQNRVIRPGQLVAWDPSCEVAAGVRSVVCRWSGNEDRFQRLVPLVSRRD
jgi:hypothetical protein